MEPSFALSSEPARRSTVSAMGAGNVDCRTFARTVKVVLGGRALETIPVREYVWERINRVLANEELL